MKRILIVEDDVNLGIPMSAALEYQGFSTKYLSSGLDVFEIIEDFHPDIILMDVNLNEDKNGFEIAREIRNNYQIPVIFTTSRDSNSDFREGFEIENTDYIRKPYILMELVMRINAMLSRQQKNVIQDNVYRIGDLTFFPREQSLRLKLEKIHLTNYESSVLTILCKNIGEFVNKNDIISNVWNENDPKMKEASLNNILSSLRKYIIKGSRVVLESRFKLGVRLIEENN